MTDYKDGPYRAPIMIESLRPRLRKRLRWVGMLLARCLLPCGVLVSCLAMGGLFILAMLTVLQAFNPPQIHVRRSPCSASVQEVRDVRCTPHSRLDTCCEVSRLPVP